MRLFVYKSLFIFICILVVYKLTIGSLIQNLETRIDQITSKQNTSLILNKIRGEIKSSLDKDEILDKNDAILLRKFLDKVKSELQTAN